ncbi:uncharacterized protein LOC127882217 isoform X1 [Dreissena polymorpha]|uniref:Uncharacterized protein n=1 Tax=Dreissena polymorpha TaxID=45954 RepID=A0A9D4JNW5_DREPO|nr:uncharacterized protein LOC127882217 isoform X1 [Dreissena polymorpha]KAH3817324.1 hypothetical protein DPMN_118857 [Dreissena polymorpha]
MAASKTYYARPVYMANKGDQLNSRSSELMNTSKSRPRTVHFTSLEDTDPPPRPPPPRPTPSGAPKGNMTGSKIQAIKRQLPMAPNPSPQSTSEPKPLTRINVTSHDQLWQKDTGEENGSRSNGLSLPLNHITKESTEEMIRNFDLETMSDHSDASADTMIMMTTEEELKNQEKINHSLKQYASKRFQQEPSLETLKSNTNTHSKKKNMRITFADMNGKDVDWQCVPNGIAEDAGQGNKISPLHITTDPYSNREYREDRVSSEPNTTDSSASVSPDDGYGTFSSTGTVSSPFSSSCGSNDFENFDNGGLKKCFLPNGAIKPNSVRESWAVRRKQRMIEAQDNSVQEQLRSLTIIEEEQMVNQNSNKNLKSSHFGTIKNSEWKTGLKGSIAFDNKDEESQFVNVSRSDLHRVNQKLYVVSNDNETHNGGSSRQERVLPRTPTLQDPPFNPTVPMHASQFPADHVTYAVPVRRRSTKGEVVSDDVRNTYASVRRPGIEETEPKRMNDFLHQVPPVERQTYAWEQDSEAGTDNMGPIYRRAVVEPNACMPIGSGNIYQSANGDEGFYSLNRSSRSTSVSSFLPVNEPSATPRLGAVQSDGPRSPLEALSGEMLEKFSEMDMNYRNFNGFDDKNEIFCRTDSKVNYFQAKQINRMYRDENNPQTQEFGSARPLQQTCVQSETMARQTSTRQASKSDSKHETSKSSSSSKQEEGRNAKHEKEMDNNSKGSKLFQILPNMFKPSNKKSNKGIKDKDSKESKGKRKLPVPLSVPVKEINEDRSEIDENEQAEYINMSDLPQYSLASVEYEEKLRKGQYVSLESLNKRPVFASSRDIQKLFSTHDQSFDSIHSHGTQRHSFHAMPLTYRHHIGRNTSVENMRPRAASASASTKTTQLQNSADSHMALINRKNAAVMMNAKQDNVFHSHAMASVPHSMTLSQRTSESRTRLDSGSSGGDSKLSTLV